VQGELKVTLVSGVFRGGAAHAVSSLVVVFSLSLSFSNCHDLDRQDILTVPTSSHEVYVQRSSCQSRLRNGDCQLRPATADSVRLVLKVGRVAIISRGIYAGKKVRLNSPRDPFMTQNDTLAQSTSAAHAHRKS
jgi:hypothetical protein